MPAKTRYKRSTWKKNQLQQNMNTPRLGNKACRLCPSGSGDQSSTNLNAHVSDSQTCADIHLQLSLLRYDNAMCSVGQEQYGEICCTEPPSSSSSPLSFKGSVFVVGAVIVALCLRNKFQQRARRTKSDSSSTSSSSSDNESKKQKRRQKQDQNHHHHHGGPHMYVPNANHHYRHDQQRPHRHQQQMIAGDKKLELPTAYRRMEDVDVNGIVAVPSPIVPTRSRSRSRPKSRSRSRPKSRSRTVAARHSDDEPPTSAPSSYERMEEGIVEPPSRPKSRPKSRTRSRSRSRPKFRPRGTAGGGGGRSSSRGRTNRRQPDYTVTSNNALVIPPKTPTQLV